MQAARRARSKQDKEFRRSTEHAGEDIVGVGGRVLRRALITAYGGGSVLESLCRRKRGV